jgi:predicted nucleotidyltransferase
VIPPGAFTVHADPAIDRKIAGDLTRVRDRLRAELPRMEALVLVGSFARGEGTVRVVEGRIRPVNDYDLVIVHPDPAPADAIRATLGELARELGFGHLDAEVRTPADLSRPVAPMHDHDLKFTGRVLSGDPAILERVHAPAATDIDPGAALLLLVNRLTCPLESVTALSFRGAATGEDDRFWMAYMSAKVVLSAATAMLVWQRAYHPSYRERAARFVRLFASDAAACRLVTEATLLKLEARETSSDRVGGWLASRDFYLETLCRTAERAHGVRLADLEALDRHLGRRPAKDTVRKIVWKWLDREKHDEIVAHERRQDVQLAQLDLIRAVRPGGGFDAALTARSAARLTRVIGPIAPDWEACRAAAVDADHRFVHPIATGGAGAV